MLIRVFGLFGLFLAAGYLIEGVFYAIFMFRALPYIHDLRLYVYPFVIMSLDFFITLAMVIASVGLLFKQRWARKMWLINMSILTFLHFVLVVLRHLGTGVSSVFVSQSIAVILLTGLSWWYFSVSDKTTNVPQSEDDRVTGS